MPTSPLKAGKAYICDYLTDGTGANQELAGKTEGTDYIVLHNPKFMTDSIEQVGDFTEYSGGASYLILEDILRGKFTLTAIIASGSIAGNIAKLEKIKKYIRDRKDDRSYSYLFFRLGTSTFYPFEDKDKNQRDYLKIWWPKLEVTYDTEEPLVLSLRLEIIRRG